MTHALFAKPPNRQHLRVARFALGGVATTPITDHLRQQAYESEIASWNQQVISTATKLAKPRKSQYGRVRSRP